MTATAISYHPFLGVNKRRFSFKNALAFIEKIDSPWKGNEEFAMWLVQRLGPQTVVDLGFDKGLSTIVLGYRNRGHVFGIDWFEAGRYAEKSFALDSAFRSISHAIRFNYVKNIHLIIGPFCEVSKTWKRKIDLLHIDSTSTYFSAKQHYSDWIRYLDLNGVILMNDVLANPCETGRFFQELAFPKVILNQGRGLGIATHDEGLIREIRKKFFTA